MATIKYVKYIWPLHIYGRIRIYAILNLFILNMLDLLAKSNLASDIGNPNILPYLLKLQ